jgi:hypothetical protein
MTQEEFGKAGKELYLSPCGHPIVRRNWEVPEKRRPSRRCQPFPWAPRNLALLLLRFLSLKNQPPLPCTFWCARACPNEQNGLAAELRIANLKKAKFQIGEENHE